MLRNSHWMLAGVLNINYEILYNDEFQFRSIRWFKMFKMFQIKCVHFPKTLKTSTNFMLFAFLKRHWNSEAHNIQHIKIVAILVVVLFEQKFLSALFKRAKAKIFFINFSSAPFFAIFNLREQWDWWRWQRICDASTKFLFTLLMILP